MERANTGNRSEEKQTSTARGLDHTRDTGMEGEREAKEAVMAKVAFRLWRASQSRGRRHMRARP